MTTMPLFTEALKPIQAYSISCTDVGLYGTEPQTNVQSTFGNFTLPAPTLNITVHDTPPRLNRTKGNNELDDDSGHTGKTAVFLSGNQTYSQSYVETSAQCQAQTNYQWGFSFIQLALMLMLLLLWTSGILTMYATSKLTRLRRGDRTQIAGEYRAVFELADAMHSQLLSLENDDSVCSGGDARRNLSEGELRKRIETQLRGGEISYGEGDAGLPRKGKAGAVEDGLLSSGTTESEKDGGKEEGAEWTVKAWVRREIWWLFALALALVVEGVVIAKLAEGGMSALDKKPGWGFLQAFGGAHTAGIFSDMTVDGPVIGTLVAIIDRARNLPNKRTMGKQDPYCAARLGKEAKKTQTDKRGGQTPRWDQELRFTVHDSPDYQRIKVSVFNDDRKTELIGDTFIGLTNVIHPGGGQADGWHTLDCRGKYAGEIRIEFTYYDTRPKAEKPGSEKKRESSQVEGASPTVAGPRGARGAREPIKRRPLPSDPTATSSSPMGTPESRPEPRGLQGVRAGPRELGSPRHAQAQEPAPAPLQPARRPVPEQSPQPTSNHSTPVRQQPPQEAYTPSNPRTSDPNLARHSENFDMSYAAPKPYEVKPVDALPRHVTEPGNVRTMSQVQERHAQPPPVDAVHSHSAPVVPTQHTYEQDHHSLYDDPSYHVAPLRSSRSNLRNQEHGSPVEQYRPNSYIEAPPVHEETHSRRRQSAMQPTVEDEDFDLPPPPPAHRKNAATIPHKHSYSSSNHYQSDSPAPLNFGRYHEPSPEPAYDLQRQPYAAPDFDYRQPGERRYTHPRPAQSNSRPVSRDTMASSPLKQEMSLPSALVAGFDATRGQRDSYQAPPSYEPPARLRQYSEPAEYRAPPDYTSPIQPHELVHYQAQPPQDSYYDHDPPEEPCRRSPINEYAPVYRPRAHSPNPPRSRNASPMPSPRHSPHPMEDRAQRMPGRSMPTRKSVSPRPPPPDEDFSQRRLSGIPFGPDDFNVLNPSLSKPADEEPERPGSRMEYNDKGQIVTFSGRVVDASDHLPIDNWAPEPEPKGTVKEKAPRIRAQLNGSRTLQEAQMREEKYRRDRAERDRISMAADVTFGSAEPPPVSQALVMRGRGGSFQDSSFDPGSALVLAGSVRDDYADRRPVSRGYDAGRPVSRGFDGGASARPVSRGYEAASGRPVSRGYEQPARTREALRERHSPNTYGSGGGFGGARGGAGAPPIPAKIPLGMQSEDVALSLELQSIDIGPGSGGRSRPRTRGREYGAYI
ncbi:hypothetical protein E8E13_006955 [Curvularia kusanoi]|uniref:C2 domain-containing protein n=1 Tax=Curvularia kusanoi TaxID=90978 RepID=A0A9P4T9C7_CURKU|nr:hypothetical protein E8E13_006955 [Curvularia kusanoi]